MVGTAHPMRGGLAQYNALLARELSQEHDVDFVSFTRQYPSILFPGKTQMDTSEDPIRFPATALVDSIGPLSWDRAARHLVAGKPPLDGLVFKYWMPFFAPAFGTIARRVKKYARAASSGAGSAAGASAGIRKAAAAGPSAGPRVVAILDNLIPHERRPFDRELTRYFMGGVDAYVAMSASVRDDLLAVDPSASCLLVPHPVFHTFGERIEKAEARKRLGLDPDARLLLFFGFIRDYKGLDVLLDAMPRITAETGAHLFVLGEFYADKNKTTSQIESLGIGPHVTLRDGYVPDEEVGLYFSAVDAIVLPYRSATQSGIVPIAYQLERPVLCTDVGGLAEIVLDGETGLVVPPADPGALADAVRRFYDESLEERCVPRIQVEKRKYSWERMAGAVVAQIRGVPWTPVDSLGGDP
ncbi:MAG: glycosyltransferase [Candidatus Eisenbacteria bacterium]